MSYRPREKLQKNGVASLTDRELVQLLVSSGTRNYRVGGIARKVLAAIKSQNADPSYQELTAIPGLGVARSSRLLAAFELAARYPLRQKEVCLDSFEEITRYLGSEVAADQHEVITTDGARYMINRRCYRIRVDQDVSELLRHVVRDVVADAASGVIVILRSRLKSITPVMSGLMVARDLGYISKFLGFRVDNVVIEQDGNYQRIDSI